MTVATIGLLRFSCWQGKEQTVPELSSLRRQRGLCAGRPTALDGGNDKQGESFRNRAKPWPVVGNKQELDATTSALHVLSFMPRTTERLQRHAMSVASASDDQWHPCAFPRPVGGTVQHARACARRVSVGVSGISTCPHERVAESLHSRPRTLRWSQAPPAAERGLSRLVSCPNES